MSRRRVRRSRGIRGRRSPIHRGRVPRGLRGRRPRGGTCRRAVTSLPLRMTVRCSSMCRCSGCTQPPPPFLISQRLKLPFFCWASGVLPAGFFRLVPTVAGSNGEPLISHSISPPALPRSSSKIEPVVEHALPVARQRRDVAQELVGRGHHAVVGCVVADHDLDYRHLVVRVGAEPRRVGPHPAVRHLHDVGQVDDIALGRRRTVLVAGEVDDELAPLGRPQFERVTLDRRTGSSPPSEAIWVNCMHCWPSGIRY